ncbi:hypothetical protein SHIRM173S_00280 [Streptomyces hirsutus]
MPKQWLPISLSEWLPFTLSKTGTPTSAGKA